MQMPGGNGHHPQPDAVDAAIQQAATPRRFRVQVNISSTQRQVLIDAPADVSDSELLEFVGWVGSQLKSALDAERRKTAGGRIVLPGGPLPPAQ
jgi:hypothetical protein